MREITLTARQVILAASIGFNQQLVAVLAGVEPRHRGGSLWGGTIESSCAELAASIVTGLPWTGGIVWTTPPKIRVPDIGDNGEVRWVDPKKEGGLVLTFDARKDFDDRRYYLASGFAPHFQIHASIMGKLCRQSDWFKRYPERDTFRVPVGAMEQL